MTAPPVGTTGGWRGRGPAAVLCTLVHTGAPAAKVRTVPAGGKPQERKGTGSPGPQLGFPLSQGLPRQSRVGTATRHVAETSAASPPRLLPPKPRAPPHPATRPAPPSSPRGLAFLLLVTWCTLLIKPQRSTGSKVNSATNIQRKPTKAIKVGNEPRHQEPCSHLPACAPPRSPTGALPGPPPEHVAKDRPPETCQPPGVMLPPPTPLSKAREFAPKPQKGNCREKLPPPQNDLRWSPSRRRAAPASEPAPYRAAATPSRWCRGGAGRVGRPGDVPLHTRPSWPPSSRLLHEPHSAPLWAGVSGLPMLNPEPGLGRGGASSRSTHTPRPSAAPSAHAHTCPRGDETGEVLGPPLGAPALSEEPLPSGGPLAAQARGKSEFGAR